MKMDFKSEKRLCMVKDKLGYLLLFEQYSAPIEPSLMVGGYPGGTFSRVFGVVEFSDGVKRVEIDEINFCDEDHDYLCELEKNSKEGF